MLPVDVIKSLMVFIITLSTSDIWVELHIVLNWKKCTYQQEAMLQRKNYLKSTKYICYKYNM